MNNQAQKSDVRLDVLGLFLAGLINTFLAMFAAGVVFAPGTAAGQPDLLMRIEWIAAHQLRWQAGWFFWFAVTLSFAWSYYALGRHLQGNRGWYHLAVGVALIAAAIDLVGVLINMVVLPEVAHTLTLPGGEIAWAWDAPVMVLFHSMESLSYALTNVAAFGLYSFAGVLLLPNVFATTSYPRWLAWLGVVEWGIALLATGLLLIAPAVAMVPLLISFILYAPWVWGSGLWIWRVARTT